MSISIRHRVFLALRSLFAIGILLVAACAAKASDPLHVQIDKAIANTWPDYESKAAPRANDAEFLRRVYLDFSGRIPSAEEARKFLQDPAPDKRSRLIDQLLNSDAYTYHMRDVFDALFIERRQSKHVKHEEWQEFLRQAFAKNQPYDELVQTILSADGADAKTRPAALFYLSREGEPHEITRDVSRLFLGMNLQCAQCHDHPLVQSYKQDFYYGIYAFFSRSYLVNDKALKQTVLAEKAEGEVTFQSVFVPKVTKKTGPHLPDGPTVKEKELPKGEEYVIKPAKDTRSVPKFSRRNQLPGLLANEDYAQFKRAAANRFWAMLMGRGLIHPIDFDHPENPPSHPELLNLLADQFAQMNFDIKAFMREIALSKTYQRSSRMANADKLPPEDKFAIAALRPLSAEQFAWSTLQATGMIDVEMKRLGAKANEEALRKRLEKNITPFVRVLGGSPGQPADANFEATLDQTLFLQHGGQIRSWLMPRNGNLTDRLAKLKDANEIADELFLSVLTRFPTTDEKNMIADYLRRNASNRSAALQELGWALVASAEFRFNH